MPNSSSDLKIRNAQYKQQVIEQVLELKNGSPNALLAQIAFGVVETGSRISEQICELREAVDRLTNSLPKSEPNSEVK